MISFILIGRNESQHLAKCFKSIYRAISTNKLEEYEIIYVDSNSIDNSIDIALSHNVDKIYQLTEIWNAAIGRNIGAKHAIGEILCFLDGDMELEPDFISHIIDNQGNLKYNIVSGNLIQVYCDENGVIIKEQIAFQNIGKIIQKPITGGAFFIKSDVYKEIGGMDNRFRRSEDPEFGLRLAKQGYLLTFLPHVFVRHNTEIPRESKVSELFKGDFLYGNLLMYKYNLFSKYTFKRIITHDPTLAILIISIGFSIFVSPYFLLCYFIALLVRVRFKFTKKSIVRFFYILLRDIAVFVLFIPFNKSRIDTESVDYSTIKKGIIY